MLKFILLLTLASVIFQIGLSIYLHLYGYDTTVDIPFWKGVLAKFAILLGAYGYGAIIDKLM